jgi:hypothetical protein
MITQTLKKYQLPIWFSGIMGKVKKEIKQKSYVWISFVFLL